MSSIMNNYQTKFYQLMVIFRFAKDNVLRFLVGNKCDLESKRQVTTDQGKEMGMINIF